MYCTQEWLVAHRRYNGAERHSGRGKGSGSCIALEPRNLRMFVKSWASHDYTCTGHGWAGHGSPGCNRHQQGTPDFLQLLELCTGLAAVIHQCTW